MYRFYRDLIRYREQGDPKILLRFINPREASLIDASVKIHVRFRLAGQSFPPMICYKIYVERNLVDLNAFSPRDYTSAQQIHPFFKFNRAGELPEQPSGWYERFENNEWRPVLDTALLNMDHSVVQTEKRTKKYHYAIEKRTDFLLSKRLEKQTKWVNRLTKICDDIDDQGWIEWSQALDFDDYQQSWGTLATTAGTD